MATQLDTIQALCNEILSRVQTAPATPAPAPPAPSDGSAEFLALFAVPSPTDFQVKYGVAFKSKLPAINSPNEKMFLDYAAAGYNAQGEYCGGPVCVLGEVPEQVAALAVDDCAHGKATYYTDFGQADSKVCAYLAKTGAIDSLAKTRATMGGRDPGRYRGLAWADFWPTQILGGSPSGG